MKVIMLQDVGGVGQRGKVVEVSDGYALNLLIPQGKAIQATPEKEAEAKKRIAAESAHKQEEEAKLIDAIKSLEHAEVKISARATEKGGLFKAITATDLAQAILDQKKLHVPHMCIQLAKPLKETGEHIIEVKKEKVSSKMRVVISAA